MPPSTGRAIDKPNPAGAWGSTAWDHIGPDRSAKFVLLWAELDSRLSAVKCPSLPDTEL